MNRKLFTEEQQQLLRQNPYIYSVTETRITLTKEFKELFIKKYNEGMTPRQILIECGYNPDMLGDRRIWGIAQHLKEQYTESGGSFSQGYTGCRSSKKTAEHLSEKEEIRLLWQEVDYLKQEIEFLKKISSIRTTRK